MTPESQRTKKWREANGDRYAAYMKAYRAAHKNELKQQTKEWRDAHPEYRDKKRVSDRQYYHEKVKTDPSKIARMAVTGKQWAAANPDKCLEKRVRYQKNHRAELAEKAKAAYWANHEANLARNRSEEHKAYQTAYQAAHAEELDEYRRAYRLANAEKIAAKFQERYASHRADYIARAEDRQRKLSQRGSYTQEEIDRLYDSQCGKCAGCGKAIERTRDRKVKNGYEVDHIMPVKLSGKNTIDNLQLLCRSCNRKKHAMHPDAWAARIGKLFI